MNRSFWNRELEPVRRPDSARSDSDRLSSRACRRRQQGNFIRKFDNLNANLRGTASRRAFAAHLNLYSICTHFKPLPRPSMTSPFLLSWILARARNGSGPKMWAQVGSDSAWPGPGPAKLSLCPGRPVSSFGHFYDQIFAS